MYAMVMHVFASPGSQPDLAKHLFMIAFHLTAVEVNMHKQK